MYLFIDSTINITIGLLDKNYEWLEYKYIESKKSSALLHSEIEQVLTKNNLNINEVLGLVYISGPGSYTGMRVSEGIAQIFNWRKIPIYSFYHFDVPELVGASAGYFIAKAFKGEYFEYDTIKREKRLALISTYKILDEDYEIYSNEMELGLPNIISTSNLIKNNSKSVFKTIIEKGTLKDIYYYRELEEEFKRNE